MTMLCSTSTYGRPSTCSRFSPVSSSDARLNSSTRPFSSINTTDIMLCSTTIRYRSCSSRSARSVALRPLTSRTVSRNRTPRSSSHGSRLASVSSSATTRPSLATCVDSTVVRPRSTASARSPGHGDGPDAPIRSAMRPPTASARGTPNNASAGPFQPTTRPSASRSAHGSSSASIMRRPVAVPSAIGQR